MLCYWQESGGILECFSEWGLPRIKSLLGSGGSLLVCCDRVLDQDPNERKTWTF